MKNLVMMLTSLALVATTAAREVRVATVGELQGAVATAVAGTVIEIAAGTYALSAPLEPGSGISLVGAGIAKTVITHTPDWQPATTTLPDPEVRTQGLDSRAYLIRVQDKAEAVTIAGLTLRGPQLHGAIYGFGTTKLIVRDMRIEDFLWSGIRTLAMKEAQILNCEFVDAGGRWQKGKPGVKGGITGGAIFATWMKDSEIAHNRFTRTQMSKQDEFYGIKVRQGKRCRIHHNTINVNFSIEMPFENDEDVEIDHNVLLGTVSIPKYAGGPVPASGRTFHIHHNYFTQSYAIEFVRNGVEIDHNLFDFDTAKDGGNLISAFGKAPAAGPAHFHNNLVNNPGRGVMWMNEPYGKLIVEHNEVVARTTATPRKDGLFGFSSKSDFGKMIVRNNKVTCIGLSRPLFRNEESYAARVSGNELTNVADADRFTPPEATASAGLVAPLSFHCGVRNERQMDGWTCRFVEK